MKRLYLLLIVFVSGCTTQYAQLASDSSLAGNATEGVILLSITEPEVPDGWNRRWFPSLIINKKDGSDQGYLSSFIYGGFGDNNAAGMKKYRHESDFSKLKGSLVAVKAIEGDYNVIEAEVFINGYEVWAVVLEDLEKFEVRKGKVTYLGEYQFYISKGKNAFGMDTRVIEAIKIKDSYYRDIELFHAKYPQLSGM